jgi:MFS family permease
MGTLERPAAVEAQKDGDGVTTESEAPLWRNWRFQVIWLGSCSAHLGMSVADFAYPLVILALTGSPAMAALFGFIQTATSLAAGLPAGVLVDRWDRRRVLMGAEVFRGLASGSVFVAWATDHLTVGHLLGVAAILGAAGPLGGAARMLVVRAVVAPRQLTKALTQDEVRSAATGLAGPPLSGVLLSIGRALPFFLCALTFALSFLTALMVRIPRADRKVPPVAGDDQNGGGVFQGIRELWLNKMIRSALTMISIVNVGGNALFLAVVVLLSGQGVSTRSIGVAVAGEAVGNLLGAALVGPLHKRVGPGKLLLLVTGVLTGSVALLAAPLGPWWVFGVLTVSMLGLPSLRVLIDVLIVRQVPDERQGRTITALIMFMTVGMPVGTLLGGLALQFLGATVTILVICGICALGLLVGLSDRALRQAQWPDAATGQ